MAKGGHGPLPIVPAWTCKNKSQKDCKEQLHRFYISCATPPVPYLAVFLWSLFQELKYLVLLTFRHENTPSSGG